MFTAQANSEELIHCKVRVQAAAERARDLRRIAPCPCRRKQSPAHPTAAARVPAARQVGIQLGFYRQDEVRAQ